VTPFDPRLPIIAAEARVKTPHVYHCWQAMSDQGAAFHVTAFAAFAGLEERHVTAIMAAIQIHAPLTAKRAAVTRGTRLAADWTLPDEWSAWASDLRKWYPADVEAEAQFFANYWQAKSGQAATKVDWFKTWQNWCRQSHRPDGGFVRANAAPLIDHAEQMERTAALYERMGRYQEADDLRRQLSSNVVPINRETRTA
jgi:hypothetical protein